MKRVAAFVVVAIVLWSCTDDEEGGKESSGTGGSAGTAGSAGSEEAGSGGTEEAGSGGSGGSGGTTTPTGGSGGVEEAGSGGVVGDWPEELELPGYTEPEPLCECATNASQEAADKVAAELADQSKYSSWVASELELCPRGSKGEVKGCPDNPMLRMLSEASASSAKLVTDKSLPSDSFVDIFKQVMQHQYQLPIITHQVPSADDPEPVAVFLSKGHREATTSKSGAGQKVSIRTESLVSQTCDAFTVGGSIEKPTMQAQPVIEDDGTLKLVSEKNPDPVFMYVPMLTRLPDPTIMAEDEMEEWVYRNKAWKVEGKTPSVAMSLPTNGKGWGTAEVAADRRIAELVFGESVNISKFDPGNTGEIRTVVRMRLDRAEVAASASKGNQINSSVAKGN